MTELRDTLVVALKIGPLIYFVLFFWLARIMFVFDQTLVEHLYCD